MNYKTEVSKLMNATEETIESQMMDYLTGRMSAEQQQAFRLLLADHPEHSQELLELEQMMAVFDQHSQQPVPEPSAHMDAGFYAMLNEQVAAEQASQKAARWSSSGETVWHRLFSWSRLQTAGLACSLLAVAFLLGHNRQLLDERKHWQLTQASQQQQQIQALTVLSMLDMPSANKRMMAINLAAMNTEPGQPLIQAMLTTLSQDNNVNVRLQALDTLTIWMQHHDSNYLREGLVAAIDHQQSPMVQIALADLLQRIGEPQAVKPLQKLLEQDQLIEPVRAKLSETVQQLI
jgi:anti-sigma factor RsiW